MRFNESKHAKVQAEGMPVNSASTLRPHRTVDKAAVLCAVAFVLSGCAGPSRKQYAALLHECRELNREHLRLYKACEERLVVNGIPVPEQAAGAAEAGLGGW
jgi:hypothetical protein